MHNEQLNNNREYHRITSSEINSFKAYLPRIRYSLVKIRELFIGKTKTYIYVVNNREIKSIPVTFQNKHFMHLCGVKYDKGAKGFINDLKHNKLKLENLYLKEDGSTFQKLEVIDKIPLLNELGTMISIGNNMARIHYDNLLRTEANILGIAIDTDANGIHFPLSLLKISAKDAHTLTSFEVIAILEEDQKTHIKKCLVKKEHCPARVIDCINERIHYQAISDKTNA